MTGEGKERLKFAAQFLGAWLVGVAISFVFFYALGKAIGLP